MMFDCVVLLFFLIVVFLFFKQKTAYEMRISDWSSDVCSSDLNRASAWLFDQRDDAGRDRGRRSPVLDAQLDEDLLEMLVHGPRADVHDLARVAIGFALGDPEQDVALARGQAQRTLKGGGLHSLAQFGKPKEEIGRASCRERVCQYV